MTPKLSLFLFASLLAFAFTVDPKTYVYKRVGDLDISLDVFVPTISIYNKYPIVFITHSGGFMLGSRVAAIPQQQFDEILKRGWVAVSVDYRLSAGALLDDIIQDSQDAYNWVRTELPKHTRVDPDRITVFGGSAGGGLAVLNGYFLTPRPKAIISFYPFCTNFTDPYSEDFKPVSDEFVALADNFRQNIAGYNVTGSDDPRMAFFLTTLAQHKFGWLFATKDPKVSADQLYSMLKRLSAVYNVDKNYPPTYLSHGLNDSLVPYNQSVQMGEQLKAMQIPYTLDLVPDAEHGYDFTATPEIYKKHVLPAFEFAKKYMIGFLDEEIESQEFLDQVKIES